LSGSEEKVVEFMITCFAQRKNYKIKSESMLKAIGFVLKKFADNEQGKVMLEKYASNLSKEEVGLLG